MSAETAPAQDCPPEAPGVPACFFLLDAIDSKTHKGYHICLALEKVVGDGNIIGGGDLKEVFRIYCRTSEARNKLLLEGVTIGDVHVTISDKNPKIVSDIDRKSEKLIVGDVPLSLATEEIDKVIGGLDGVRLRSKWFDEMYRNDKQELSLFKTGRRFVYIDVPPKPLPRYVKIGHFRASVYHYSQKPRTDDKKKDDMTHSNDRHDDKDRDDRDNNKKDGDKRHENNNNGDSVIVNASNGGVCVTPGESVTPAQQDTVQSTVHATPTPPLPPGGEQSSSHVSVTDSGVGGAGGGSTTQHTATGPEVGHDVTPCVSVHGDGSGKLQPNIAYFFGDSGVSTYNRKARSLDRSRSEHSRSSSRKRNASPDKHNADKKTKPDWFELGKSANVESGVSVASDTSVPVTPIVEPVGK